MSNAETLKLQKCLGEARRTLSERKMGWEKVLQHMADQGKPKDEIKVKEQEFHERIDDMAGICNVLEQAVLAANEMGSGAHLISYQGEVMLSNWSETAAAGRKVEFWLPEGADAPDEHPFKYYTRRLRASAGTRFQMVLVEIDDDDKPLPRGTGEAKPRLTQGGELVGGAIAKHAGRLCKDSDFHEFMMGLDYEGDPPDCNEETATAYVRKICKVQSRRELDHDRDAQMRYENRIVRPFNHWLESQGGTA
jgi:hypothetical protein